MSHPDEKDEAIADGLRQLLKPGDTVWLIRREVSWPLRLIGTSVVDVLVIRGNKPTSIAESVAALTAFKFDTRHEGIRVEGSPSGIWRSELVLVRDLGTTLYPDLPRDQFKDRLPIAYKYL